MSNRDTTPPWTPQQVASLNDYQVSGVGHPFTCPRDRQALVATQGGWHCPVCHYEQHWAHPWMADDTWRTWAAELAALGFNIRA